VEFLHHRGHIAEMGHYSATHVAQGIQDLLICGEMMVAAVVFFFAFPLGDFVQRAPAPPAAAAPVPSALVAPVGPRSRFGTLT
jgi:Organic solute transporter Ostalpha